MYSLSTTTWGEAVKGFYLHKRATTSRNTAVWYRGHLSALVNWSEENDVSLDQFTKRSLDAFLVSRADSGLKPTTLHHNALASCVFFEWCSREKLIDRDPLVEYKVRSAPTPPKYMPTDEDIQKLLDALLDFYDSTKNPTVAVGHSVKNRSFHRDRNYTIELTKLDTCCRIGEILNLKVSDWQDGQLTIREAKGRQPRVLPISPTLTQALDEWMKVRMRIAGKMPASEDEGWLFISERGDKVDYHSYVKSLRRVVEWAGLDPRIRNHSQRRFSLNRMAKDPRGGLMFAQGMAGHRDPKTTMIYLKIDGDYLRETHAQVNVLGNLLTSKRAKKRAKLV